MARMCAARRFRAGIGLLMAAAIFLATQPRQLAQTADPDPARFAKDIAAFQEWDTRNWVPDDAVLFVGSSTIRLWDTAARFPARRVVNRGFGGSQISDVNHYLDAVALKYRPATVVFYAGDNDINDGKTPERVAADFRTFVNRVLAVRGDARIVFLSIKPSPSRWAKWPQMQDANSRIRSYLAGRAEEGSRRSQFVYVDVATPMLGADGQPRAELFVEDRLHLSSAGYDLWTRELEQILASSPTSGR
jgi:lysophospholipase L1-like esterase